MVSKAAPLPRERALRDGLTVALCFPRRYPALVLELLFRSAGGVVCMGDGDTESGKRLSTDKKQNDTRRVGIRSGKNKTTKVCSHRRL